MPLGMNIPYRCPNCGEQSKFATLNELRCHLEMEHSYQSSRSRKRVNLSDFDGPGRAPAEHGRVSPLLEQFHADALFLQEELRKSKEEELNNRRRRAGGSEASGSLENIALPSIQTRKIKHRPQSRSLSYREHGFPSRVTHHLRSDSQKRTNNESSIGRAEGDFADDSNPRLSLTDDIYSFHGIENTNPNSMRYDPNKKHITESLSTLSKEVLIERASHQATAETLYSANETLSSVERAAEERIALQQRVIDDLAGELKDKERRMTSMMQEIQSLRDQQHSLRNANILDKESDFEAKHKQQELVDKQKELDALAKNIEKSKQFILVDNLSKADTVQKLAHGKASKLSSQDDRNNHLPKSIKDKPVTVLHATEQKEPDGMPQTRAYVEEQQQLSNDDDLTNVKLKAQQLEKDRHSLLLEMQGLLETAALDNDNLRQELKNQEWKLNKMNHDLKFSKHEQAELLDETHELYHQADLGLTKLKTMLKERDRQLSSITGALDQAREIQEKLLQERDDSLKQAAEREGMYRAMLAANTDQLNTMKEALAVSQESKSALEQDLHRLHHQMQSKGMEDLELKQKMDNLSSELRKREGKQARLKGEVQRREEKLKRAKGEMERMTEFLKTTADKEASARTKLEDYISRLIERAEKAETDLRHYQKDKGKRPKDLKSKTRPYKHHRLVKDDDSTPFTSPVRKHRSHSNNISHAPSVLHTSQPAFSEEFESRFSPGRSDMEDENTARVMQKVPGGTVERSTFPSSSGQMASYPQDPQLMSSHEIRPTYASALNHMPQPVRDSEEDNQYSPMPRQDLQARAQLIASYPDSSEPGARPTFSTLPESIRPQNPFYLHRPRKQTYDNAASMYSIPSLPQQRTGPIEKGPWQLFQNTPEVDRIMKNSHQSGHLGSYNPISLSGANPVEAKTQVTKSLPGHAAGKYPEFTMDEDGIMWERHATPSSYNSAKRMAPARAEGHVPYYDDTDVEEDISDYVYEPEHKPQREFEGTDNDIGRLNVNKSHPQQHLNQAEKELEPHHFDENEKPFLINQPQKYGKREHGRDSAGQYASDSSDGGPLHKARLVQKRVEELTSPKPWQMPSSPKPDAIKVDESDFSTSSYASFRRTREPAERENSLGKNKEIRYAVDVEPITASKQGNAFSPPKLSNSDEKRHRPHSSGENSKASIVEEPVTATKKKSAFSVPNPHSNDEKSAFSVPQPHSNDEKRHGLNSSSKVFANVDPIVASKQKSAFSAPVTSNNSARRYRNSSGENSKTSVIEEPIIVASVTERVAHKFAGQMLDRILPNTMTRKEPMRSDLGEMNKNSYDRENPSSFEKDRKDVISTSNLVSPYEESNRTQIMPLKQISGYGNAQEQKNDSPLRNISQSVEEAEIDMTDYENMEKVTTAETEQARLKKLEQLSTFKGMQPPNGSQKNSNVGDEQSPHRHGENSSLTEGIDNEYSEDDIDDTTKKKMYQSAINDIKKFVHGQDGPSVVPVNYIPQHQATNNKPENAQVNPGTQSTAKRHASRKLPETGGRPSSESDSLKSVSVRGNEKSPHRDAEESHYGSQYQGSDDMPSQNSENGYAGSFAEAGTREELIKDGSLGKSSLTQMQLMLSEREKKMDEEILESSSKDEIPSELSENKDELPSELSENTINAEIITECDSPDEVTNDRKYEDGNSKMTVAGEKGISEQVSSSEGGMNSDEEDDSKWLNADPTILEASTDTDLEKLSQPGHMRRGLPVRKNTPVVRHALRKKPKRTERAKNPQDSLSSADEVDDDANAKRKAAKRIRVSLFHVFSYLDTENLLNSSLVSKQWHKISRHPALWKHVTLHDQQISSQFLVTLSEWCTKTEYLSLKGLRGRSIHADEDPEDYNSAIRGSLEAGLERLLAACQDTITHLEIVDCDSILTDKCLWLVSGYCRLLNRLTYRSGLDPISPQLLWALGGGCPGISALYVQPMPRRLKRGAVNNQCILLISQFYRDIQEIGLGGKDFDIGGLMPLAQTCQHLRHITLEHCLPVTADLATGLCRAGLKQLQSLDIVGATVEAKALQTLQNNCRQLKKITVKINPEDVVEDPTNKKEKEKYKKMIKAIENLKSKAAFSKILSFEPIPID